MLVLGRWSVRMVCPLAKVAAELVAAPLLATAMLQFHVPVDNGTLPLTLLVFVAVRSGAVTVTLLLLQSLLASLLSMTLLLGSTAQDPPVGLV